MSPGVLILNGPNLNLLGAREPDIYGAGTLAQIEAATVAHAAGLGLTVTFRQSNAEGELIDWIQAASPTDAGIIINAGAYSHTSVAILDALLACPLPVIEVHLSNIYQRDEFRHHSYISKAATGVICGLGSLGYLLALDAVAAHLNAGKT